MIVLHGLKACDTCRKALKALAAQGIDARLRDLRSEEVTPEEVTSWFDQFGGNLLNTRSTTWRGLSEDERSGEPVALMVANPALIKRPLIEAPSGRYLGWSPATRTALGLES